MRPKSNAERAIDAVLAGSNLRGSLFAKVRQPMRTARHEPLLRTVARITPRLITQDYVPGLYWLGRLTWVRPVEHWTPKGKGRDTLFRSLAGHLLASYPTPAFLYNAFFEDEAERLTPIVANLAAGGSLYRACQAGALPVPLTRRMCHQVMSSPGRSNVMSAIRRAQIAAAGGNAKLLTAWLRTEAGARLGSVESERFWHRVLAWFANNPGISSVNIGPLVDYIAYRHAEDATFSMKGRTETAMLRRLAQWHRALAEVRSFDGPPFTTSGFQAASFDRSRRNRTGAFERRVWHIEEILTRCRLAEEGRAMHHCVYSYAPAIACGQSSIWSMKLEEGGALHRAVTIEVRNATRRIVQVRGRQNRLINPIEHQILLAWAELNGLSLHAG